MSYEFMGGGANPNNRKPDYGAIEQMERRAGGGGGKSRRAKAGGDEEGILSMMGLGKGNMKTTMCCVTFFVVLTGMVTAWMQTCVPFCGAKIEKSGLWKKAWANRTIPHDMQKNMDTTVDPCDDFYKFACGGFQERTGIKADQVEWAMAWDGVESRISAELRKAVENDDGKAGTFYRACMDTATIERLGAQPLKVWLDKIDRIKDHAGLIQVVAELQLISIAAYFDWQVMADPTDPSRYVFALLDAGLTLPEAKMYTDDSPDMTRILSSYSKVVEDVLRLTGLTASQAQAAAKDALSVEMAIAKHTLPNEQLREAKPKHYTMAELDKLAPGVAFPRLLELMGGADVGKNSNNILAKDEGFLRGLSGLLSVTTFWAHKAYLRFRVAYGLGADLSDPFLKQGLQVGHILTGVKHQEPRWRKCYESTKSNLPDEVAKLFVSGHLPKKTVDDAEAMLQNIRTEFKHTIRHEDWMQPKTRKLAEEKLDNMFIQVGHGRWQAYDFDVQPHAFLNNTNNAKKWIISRALARLSKPVDRERWGSMDPTQVDGSYARQVNGVFVPGGLLQEPFFSASYPAARNYGSVGSVLGHEMTHGFDDVGRKYDMNGRRRNWWTPDDVVAFKKRAECLVTEFDNLKVNGRRTLAENIADAGGVKLSYEAFLALPPPPAPAVPIDDADKQLFFLSWGQTWCSVQRARSAKLALQTDEHAPDKDRVNAPLTQYAPFSDAYQCPTRSNMNPRQRCGGGTGPVW
mmetsp:Transcript_38149/g.90131  ORF Transcript_38149/g.90131 Transcript_38149/m.90131 type:complete len:744 (+) Transcript_38149:96-2327(+)